jgi:hypothetical protein
MGDEVEKPRINGRDLIWFRNLFTRAGIEELRVSSEHPGATADRAVYTSEVEAARLAVVGRSLDRRARYAH